MPQPPRTHIKNNVMVQEWSPRRTDGPFYVDGPGITPFLTEFWLTSYVDAAGSYHPNEPGNL